MQNGEKMLFISESVFQVHSSEGSVEASAESYVGIPPASTRTTTDSERKKGAF